MDSTTTATAAAAAFVVGCGIGLLHNNNNKNLIEELASTARQQAETARQQAETARQLEDIARQLEETARQQRIRPRRQPQNIILIEEEEEEEEEVIVPVPRREKPVYYSNSDLKQMSDSKLIKEFTRLTGESELYCSHCKRYTPLTNWVNSIRRRCEKRGGLSRNTESPKTCDKQSYVNDCCNQINNKAYPLLRANNITDRQKQLVQGLRSDALHAIGVSTDPYRYV
jgi:hypothetical protein